MSKGTRDKIEIAEDEYFHRVDAEILDRMRRQAELEEERRLLSVASRVDSETVLGALRAAGFDQQTVALLPLVPLIQVAWVDGSISRAERERVLNAARSRGIEAGTCAGIQLARWLEERPSDKVFRVAVDALKEVEGRTEAGTRSLLQSCAEIAAASGGLFGLISPISSAEKKLLDDLAQQLRCDG